MENKINKSNNNNSNLVEMIKSACFDLQFRRDVRRERLNSPTYYRWKAQFIILANKEKEKTLYKLKEKLNCGKLYFDKKGNLRFIIQKIDDLNNNLAQFLKEIKNNLPSKKQKEIALWLKAVEIIYKYKGKKLLRWQKNDFKEILNLYNVISKIKQKSKKEAKWISEAKIILESIQ